MSSFLDGQTTRFISDLTERRYALERAKKPGFSFFLVDLEDFLAGASSFLATAFLASTLEEAAAAFCSLPD